MARALALVGRLSLLGKFTIVGLIVTLAAGSVVATVVSREVTNLEIDHAAEDAAIYVNTALAPLLQDETLDRVLTGELHRRVSEKLDELLPAEIFRVKIWSVDGMLVFSDSPALVGQRLPDEERDRAVAGETVAHLEEMGSKAEHQTETEVARALEVYTPIQLPGTSRIFGVYEFYGTTDQLEQRIADMSMRVWAGSLGAFFALFASLFVLILRASRRLVAQNATIRKRLREARLLNCVVLAASSERSPTEIKATVCRELETLCGVTCSVGEDTDAPVVGDGNGHRPGTRLTTPLRAGRHAMGTLIIESPQAGILDQETRSTIDGVAAATAVALRKAILLDDLARANKELQDVYDAMIEGLARALDKRDEGTEGHSRRVTELTVRTLRALGCSEEEIAHSRRGALLHDIGKLGIPDRILLKPEALDDHEWAVMKTHPTLAYDMLAPIEHLRPALLIPYYHHERWDGTGYPFGLAGTMIPIPARAFALADVWDALSSDRPYRSAWSQDCVMSHLQRSAGSHFDPDMVHLFVDVVMSYVADNGLPTEPSASGPFSDDRRACASAP